MTVATRAKDLDAAHAVAVIRFVHDVLGSHRFEETRPAGTGIELRVGRKERQPTTNAVIDPRLFMIVKDTAERALSAFAARDLILLGGQLLAPLGIGLHHFGRGCRREQLSFAVE